MTILFTTDHFLPHFNGIVSHVVMLRDELRRRGHRVIILTPKVSDKHEEDVYYLPSYPLFFRAEDAFSLPFNTKIEKELLNLPIDVVHNHLFMTGYIGKRIAHQKNIPILATYHTFFTQYIDWIFPWATRVSRPLVRKFIKKYFEDYDIVLAPSEKAKENLQNAKVSSPMLKMHNAIDLEPFYKASDKLFLDHFNLKPSFPTLIIVGILEIGKNVDLAIRATKIMQKEFPDIRLIIAGQGKLHDSFVQLVKELNLEKNVFFAGRLSRDFVASADTASDLVLFMSDTDNFPTVLIEALAAGKPIVAIRDKAVDDLVIDGQNGFIASKDPESVANLVVKLLKDKEKFQKFGKKSLELSKQFSIKNYIDQLEKLYSDLQKNKNNDKVVV